MTSTAGLTLVGLVENPFISKVEVDLPDESTRARYARTLVESAKAARDVSREANGLTLVGLAQAVGSSGSKGDRVDLGRLREAKKELIEKQCFGLVEFLAPSYNLDTVVAPTAVKERLEQDVRLFKDGRLEALPMGYLLCGVIGTGKTFTATCLAGSLGIPTIVFKNLRSRSRCNAVSPCSYTHSVSAFVAAIPAIIGSI